MKSSFGVWLRSAERVAGWVLIGWGISGCAAPAVEGAPDGGGTMPDGVVRSVVANSGAFRVDYVVSPDPVPLNASFAVEAQVFVPVDAEHPQSDVLLRVDAAMPEHGHGMVRLPRMESGPDGVRRAAGLLFHMPGRWELYFDVTHSGRTERAQVEIQLR